MTFAILLAAFASTQVGASDKYADLLDPARQGWATEAISEAAEKQLKRIGGLLEAREPVTPDALRGLVRDDVRLGALRPTGLATVFDDGGIVVRRLEAAPDPPPPGGVERLAAQLREWHADLQVFDNVRAGFKIHEIRTTPTTVRTIVLVQISANRPRSRWQMDAQWGCDWEVDGAGPPRLASLRVLEHTQVEVASPAAGFADCTRAVLEGNAALDAQLAHGMNHWVRRIERGHGMFLYARFGLALGDVNGDGLDDVYLCQPGGLPNRLLLQRADGTARDCSREAAVDFLDHTSSALLIDLDNDGDQDLVAATSAGLVVMSNDGAARFRIRATLPTAHPDPQSLSAVDYDDDGDLDLYLCLDFAGAEDPSVGFVYHDANDGGANVLYRNDAAPAVGPWRFVDATGPEGLDVRNRRHSLAASWEDYDDDGDQDLYVANDYGQNCLYRNDSTPSAKPRFTEVAVGARVVDHGSGMSASWGDFDRDGRMDLYVGNMYSSAGRRITGQSGFMPDEDGAVRALYARFAKGNTLFRNEGGRFAETAQAGVEMGRWAWSSVFADLNNDGWDDLVVANGYITTDDTGDL